MVMKSFSDFRRKHHDIIFAYDPYSLRKRPRRSTLNVAIVDWRGRLEKRKIYLLSFLNKIWQINE